MTDQATEAPAQSVNGHAPAPDPEPAAPDTGERWLGIVLIAGGLFLMFAGFDRASGGKLTGALAGSDGQG